MEWLFVVVYCLAEADLYGYLYLVTMLVLKKQKGLNFLCWLPFVIIKKHTLVWFLAIFLHQGKCAFPRLPNYWKKTPPSIPVSTEINHFVKQNNIHFCSLLLELKYCFPDLLHSRWDQQVMTVVQSFWMKHYQRYILFFQNSKHTKEDVGGVL